MTARLSDVAPTRRAALTGALGLGVTLRFLGSPAMADTQFGAGRRLVVVICRGGMDGLSVSPPFGDPAYASLRGAIAIPPPGQSGGALPLDDTFGLHPALPTVQSLAVAGQARIAPAIATPDRERSHFEAQDVLESGGAIAYGAGSGWLNRSLEAMSPQFRPKAISLGPTAPLILRGKIEAISWSPGIAAGGDTRLPTILQDLYAGDQQLGQALAEGLATQAMAGSATSMARSMAQPASSLPLAPGAHRPNVASSRQLGATLAGFMTQADGPRIAGLELDGFDTHAGQGAGEGLLASRLAQLDAFLDGLHAGLNGPEHGEVWRDTVVVVATEFGRTARVNGTAGTDHGTASTAILLGGAVRGRGIIGDWPTLAQNRLFENRDTAPTVDMRALFKGVLRDHLGIERSKLDSLVFPDSTGVSPVTGILA